MRVYGQPQPVQSASRFQISEIQHFTLVLLLLLQYIYIERRGPRKPRKDGSAVLYGALDASVLPRTLFK